MIFLSPLGRLWWSMARTDATVASHNCFQWNQFVATLTQISHIQKQTTCSVWVQMIDQSLFPFFIWRLEIRFNKMNLLQHLFTIVSDLTYASRIHVRHIAVARTYLVNLFWLMSKVVRWANLLSPNRLWIEFCVIDSSLNPPKPAGTSTSQTCAQVLFLDLGIIAMTVKIWIQSCTELSSLSKFQLLV